MSTNLLSNQSFAQDSPSKISIALHYTPSFSFVNYRNDGGLETWLYEEIIDDDVQKFVNPASLNLYYRLNSKIEIQAGVGYQQMGHRTKLYESHLTNDFLKLTQFFVSHHFISVPLRVNYIYKSFFFGIGTDLNFHLSSQEKQISTFIDGESVTETELNNVGIFNPFICATVGYKIKMGQKVFMSFAPNVGIAPSYMFKKDVSINRRYWQAGLQVGLEYRF